MSLTKAVIVCTYNGEKYLAEELDSILKQTLPVDRIFISDDCSSDGTRDVIKHYADEHPELIVPVFNEKNLGYKKNFEQVLLKAKDYDIIFFADQDDIWLEGKVKAICDEFDRDRQNLAVFTNAKIVDKDLNQIKGLTQFDFCFSEYRRNKFRKNPRVELMKGALITGATLAVRNDVIRYCVPFAENYVHDEWIGAVSAFYGNVSYLEESCVLYRQHGNNVIGIKTEARKDFVKRNIFQKMLYSCSADTYNDRIEFLEGIVDYDPKRYARYIEVEKRLKELGNPVRLSFSSTADKTVAKRRKIVENIIKSFEYPFVVRVFFVLFNFLAGNYRKIEYPGKQVLRSVFISKPKENR